MIFVIGLIAVLAILVLAMSMSPTKDLDKTIINKTQKPVILISVDSLMSKPLQKAIQQGRAPAFSFLINHGQYFPKTISSYPTMSVSIDSTELTGTYADQHKVPGLIWFKEDEERMISYGSGISEMWHNGIQNVALDSVFRLNEEHLSTNVQTIHEELFNRHLSSASVNGLLFRGNIKHQLNVPKLISGINLLPKDIKINGPTLLSLGALSQYNSKNDLQKFIWNRMGVNNQFTVNELKYLIKQNKLPAFTLAYFPDADADLHKNGPNDLKAIEKADQHLQELLDSYSNWEEAIDKNIWIVHGDSGQSKISSDKKVSLIDLNALLKDYTFWDRKNKNGEVAIAINERMAYIYVNDENIALSDVMDTLKKDKRIGFVAWKDGEKNYVLSPHSNSELSFSPNGTYIDEYNQSWNLNGNPSILNLSIHPSKLIKYGDYPDALARLNGALHSHDGRFIIVDALPQYEFIEKHSHDHAGGAAHGSLHKVDSIVPLIVVGTDEKPKYNRLVDFKEWILKVTK